MLDTDTKKCPKCDSPKYKTSGYCYTHKSEYSREWYRNHKDKVREWNKEWMSENRDKWNAYSVPRVRAYRERKRLENAS